MKVLHTIIKINMDGSIAWQKTYIENATCLSFARGEGDYFFVGGFRYEEDNFKGIIKNMHAEKMGFIDYNSQ